MVASIQPPPMVSIQRRSAAMVRRAHRAAQPAAGCGKAFSNQFIGEAYEAQLAERRSEPVDGSVFTFRQGTFGAKPASERIPSMPLAILPPRR